MDMNTNKIKLCAFADEADPMLDGQIEALKANGISLLEIRGAGAVIWNKVYVALDAF